MDEHYTEIFNLNNEDDAYYHKIIPDVGIEIYRKVLEEDIQVINASTLNAQSWAKYKYCLLKCEEKWKTEIFQWTAGSNPKCPYVGINIYWDNLENKAIRYFLAHMSLEGYWMGDDRVSNIWEYIDKAMGINENSEDNKDHDEPRNTSHFVGPTPGGVEDSDEDHYGYNDEVHYTIETETHRGAPESLAAKIKRKAKKLFKK
jgi:hypothetical protein